MSDSDIAAFLAMIAPRSRDEVVDAQLTLFQSSVLSQDRPVGCSGQPLEWAYSALEEYQHRIRMVRGFHELVHRSICQFLDIDPTGKRTIREKFRSLNLSKVVVEYLDEEQFYPFEFLNSIIMSTLWDDLEYLALRYLGDWLEHNWETVCITGLGLLSIRVGQQRYQLRDLQVRDEEFSFLDIAQSVVSALNYRGYHGAERLSRIVGVTAVRVRYTSDIQNDLAELEALRHSVRHRQGWPSKRLLKLNPSAGEAFGVVNLSHEDLVRYGSAVATFVKQFKHALHGSYGRAS